MSGHVAVTTVRADYFQLLARAKRRLERGRTPGPGYLLEAYWAAVERPTRETVQRLAEAVRRAHA